MTHEPTDTPTIAISVIVITWLVVLIPLAWGIWETVAKVTQLF